jgi:hypothetical protein
MVTAARGGEMPGGDYQRKVESLRDTFKFTFRGIVAVASVVTAAPTLLRLGSVTDRYGWLVPSVLIGLAVVLLLVGWILASWAMNVQPEPGKVLDELRTMSHTAEGPASRRSWATSSIRQALEDRRRSEPDYFWDRAVGLDDEMRQSRNSRDHALEMSKSTGAEPLWERQAEEAKEKLRSLEKDLNDLVASVQWTQMRARMRAASIAISVAALVSIASVMAVVLQTPTPAKP